MKQFETKLTVRIYDTKLIESLNTIFKLNKNRYQTKNQLIVELLERGIKDKMKDFPTPPDSPAGASAIPLSFNNKDETAAMLKQLKEMISNKERQCSSISRLYRKVRCRHELSEQVNSFASLGYSVQTERFGTARGAHSKTGQRE